MSATGPLLVEEQQVRQVPYQYDKKIILFFSELFNFTDELASYHLTQPLSAVAW